MRRKYFHSSWKKQNSTRWRYLMVNIISSFRIQSTIYDGTVFRKLLTTFSLFSQKRSVEDVRLGYKYASEHNNSLFSDVSKVKLMSFNFFSTTHFFYHYLPQAYLKSSRTSTMEYFCENRLTFLSHSLFSQKSTIVDGPLDSNYATFRPP